MSRPAKLEMDPAQARFRKKRSWMRRCHRRLASARPLTRYLTVLALIGVVGYGDLVVGEEISFSIFYMLPIAYAAWFISANAGGAAALISAVIWFIVEVRQHPPYSRDWIPVWNATVRLGFFILGVSVVRMIRHTEARLMRAVFRRTRSLRMESDRRRRLERELMEVTAREHLRFAQDLHDGLGQYLSALAFHARMLRDDLRQISSPQTAQAERIVEIIRTTNQTIRRLDRVMSVPDARAGFAAAMRSLVDNFQKLTGVHCELELTDDGGALDPFRILMLIRIIQEALSNAVKHGHPRTIKVSTLLANGMLHTRVADDGVGLSTQPESEAGSGLRLMKLRAEMIGSQLSLRPNGNTGCIVECILPLSVPRAAVRPV